MKFDDFNKLKKELNRYEKNIRVDPVFVSCNFANIVKDHPQYIKTKANILNKNFYQYLLYVVYEIIKLIYDFFLILITSKNIISKSNNKILFISHLTSSNAIGYKDSYYGSIKNFFSKKKVVTYYINHIKKKINSSKLGKKNYLNTSINIGLKNELKILKMQISLFFKIFKNKNNFSKKIKRILLFEILKLDTKNNLRIYFHLNDIIDKCNIKYVITTCEGYPHEKIIFKLCFEKKIFSIGYQNIPLINKQILINKNLNSYLPKMIWSSDKSSETKLKNYYKKKIRVINIGSPRIFKKKLTTNLNINKTITCLAVPEGFISETQDMFLLIKNFIENHNNKKIKFIFRIHPNIKNDRLHNHIKNYSKKNMQFIFSSNDISYDIKKSNVAIYRGSSAIINCVRNGLIPIYFANKEKIEISPIGLNKFSKYLVKNSNDLSNNLNYLNSNKSFLRKKKM
tara:strand:+ start:99 stop:1463 length:1365 start_codon:yes stop_codon:yes gene_type:complete